MKLYLHTIDGRPAEFDGQQLVFAEKGKLKRYPLSTNLNRIRREQQKTIRYRKSNGFSLPKYDYVILESPSITQADE